MRVMTLNDGSVEVIQEVDEIANVVYEKLGYDAYCVIHELIQRGDMTTHKANSDLGSYEASLESNSRAFLDIQEINDMALIYLSDAKRLDRAHLASLLRENQVTISNQI